MFGSKQRKIMELLERNADLADEIQELKDKLKRKDQRDESLCDVFEELNKSSFSFDWKTAGAFSIERIFEWFDGHEFYVPITVIGYLKPDGENEQVGEWSFYCSQEEHERLVKDFNEYKKKSK